MKKAEQNFDDLNALVLRKSIWGRSGHNAKPFKIFFIFLLCGLALSTASFLTQNTAMMPAGFFLTAVAGPLAFVAYINKKTQCLSALVPEMTISTFFIGGALALIIGGTVNMVMPALDAKLATASGEATSTQSIKPLGPQLNVCEKARQTLDKKPEKDNTKVSTTILLVGFIEEGAKLVFPLIMLMLVPLAGRNVAIGLSLGALTALGFAVLESLYYGLAQFPALTDLSYIMYYCSDVAIETIRTTQSTLLFRGLTTPFGHIAWTGAASIVIWYLLTSNKSTFMKVIGGLGIFTVVSLLHSLFDFFLVNMGHVSYGTYMFIGVLLVLVASFALLYFSLRLAVFKDKPATVQVWEKLNKAE